MCINSLICDSLELQTSQTPVSETTNAPWYHPPQVPTERRKKSKLVIHGSFNEVKGQVLKADILHKIIKTENRFQVAKGEERGLGRRQVRLWEAT